MEDAVTVYNEPQASVEVSLSGKVSPAMLLPAVMHAAKQQSSRDCEIVRYGKRRQNQHDLNVEITVSSEINFLYFSLFSYWITVMFYLKMFLC